MFEALVKAGYDRGVELKFMHNFPAPPSSSNDAQYLVEKANAQVSSK